MRIARAALRVVRHGLRLLPMVVVLALVVPGSAVRPTTIGLTKVQSAEAYDFADGVVWVLVLGSDARTDASFRDADTDFFQLLGINFRTGSAAAIGIPRDSWVELPGGLERINNAYEIGGAEVAARATGDLVGIAPDYVMITGEDGFLSMLDTLGPVTVDSRLGFRAEDSDLVVRQGQQPLRGAGRPRLRRDAHPAARRLRPVPQPPGPAARSARCPARAPGRAGLPGADGPLGGGRNRHRQPVAAGRLPPAERAHLRRPGEGVRVHCPR